jgi:hypothetical protein
VKIPRRLGYYDFLADFSVARRSHGVQGVLWIETKVMAETTFDERLPGRRTALEEKLVAVHRADSRVDAVALVATKVYKDGRLWQSPKLVIQLLKRGEDEQWTTLAGKGPKKIPRGKALGKPGLQHLWDTLRSTMVKLPGQAAPMKHFYVQDFLNGLGLPWKSIGKRSVAFNATLAEAGVTDQLFQQRVAGQCGLATWVASKDALRVLYNAL